MLVCALLGAAITGTITASARADDVDRASARAYFADATRYVQTSARDRRQVRAAVGGFIARLESSCPGVLAHAPPAYFEHARGAPPWHGSGEGTPAQQTSRTFLSMALGELKLVNYTPIREPAVAFASELIHLHWTKPGIANVFADYGESILATLSLSLPDYCADARASAAIGFTSAPPEATQFANAYRATLLPNSGRNLPELASLVRPLLANRDLGILTRFQRLWSRSKPLLRPSDAIVLRLLRAVFAAHA